jgi:hypothetical protein
MTTMICRRNEEGVLQPQLLCHQHIDEFDVTKFYVENGCWDGLYVSGAVYTGDTTYCEETEWTVLTDKVFLFNGEVYHFKQKPSDEMYISARNEHSNYISNGEYNAWFELFHDLQEKGEIK